MRHLRDLARYIASDTSDALKKRQAVRALSKLVHPDRCHIRSDPAGIAALSTTPALLAKTQAFYGDFYPLVAALSPEARTVTCTEFSKTLNSLTRA